MYQETITIPANGYEQIEYKFQSGDEFELIFTLQVKDNLPIDVWLVNEENFLRLAQGTEFYYYLDGTEQNISFTRNMVTLTDYDSYKLVMTNYRVPQSVDVDIVYETRIYGSVTRATSNRASNNDPSLFGDLRIITYALFIAVIVLVILLILIFNKTNRTKEDKEKISINASSKKSKKNKKNKSKGSKESKAIVSNKKTSPKKSEKNKSNKIKPAISDKTTLKKSKTISEKSSFCGYCGEPVNTPFCKGCGNEI